MNHTNQLKISIPSKVKAARRSGNVFPAVVTDVFGDTVAVQLGNNGSIMRGLHLVGGPVKVLDAVQVDFSSDPPIVIAKGTKYLTMSDLETILKKLTTGSADATPKLEICLFSGGLLSATFPPTSSGLDTAILGAAANDVIWLPDVDITADIELPEGVTLSGISSRQSIIRGTVTINDNVGIENVKIVKPQWGDGDSIAVICNATVRSAWIKNAEIHAYHCSIGSAYAIQMAENSLLNVDQCSVIAAASNDSYAFQGATNSLAKVTHSRVLGLTDWFDSNGSFEVYANVEGSNELEWWCVVDPIYRWSGAQSFGTQAQTDFFYTKVISKPATASTSLVQTSSNVNAAYPGVIARVGNYIYLNRYDGQIREVNISTGDVVDVTVDNNYSNFVVIEERRVLYVGTSDDDHAVKLVDFENDVVSVLHTYPENEGDYETVDTIWRGDIEHGMIVTQSNGDLIIVLVGEKADYYLATEPDWAYSSGVYFLVKNWTQDTDWEIVSATLKPTSNFYYDDISLYLSPTAVQGRYITLIPSYNVAGAEIWPEGTPAHNDKAYRVMVTLDLDDMSIDVTRQEFSRGQLSFPDPEFYYSGTDHENGTVYAHYTPETDLVIYEFDPINKTISSHRTITGPVDVIYMFNKRNCYYMQINAVGDADIYRANTNTLVLEEWDIPSYDLYYCMDWVMDDNNNRFWYFHPTTGVIYGVNPENGVQTSFSTGITPAAATPFHNWLYCLGNVFVVFINKTAGGSYEYHLIKE